MAKPRYRHILPVKQLRDGKHMVGSGPSWTEEQKQRIASKLMDTAETFAADPTKGRAEGYEPIYPRRITSHEVGRAPYSMAGRSDFCAWLHAIAKRNLTDGTWRIDESMGDGRSNCQLVIF